MIKKGDVVRAKTDLPRVEQSTGSVSAGEIGLVSSKQNMGNRVELRVWFPKKGYVTTRAIDVAPEFVDANVKTELIATEIAANSTVDGSSVRIRNS